MKHIKLYPRGGLGNQLFQYGAAFHLSHKLRLPVLVNNILLSKGARFNPGLGVRNYELDKFENNLIEKNTINKFGASLLSRLLTVERLVGDKFPELLLKINIFANEKNDQLSLFNDLQSGVSINSYCGSPHYFDDCSDEIASSITKVINPSEWFQENLKTLQSERPIAINVRLGDYKNLSHIYGKPDPYYYAEGLEICRQQLGNRPIWIFSDEPELAAELLNGNIKVDRIVEQPQSPEPIEYLNLLGLCDGIVCANSSFSWWGGFLSNYHHKNSTIIFPRPMFNTEKLVEPFNWLPSSWMTIGRNLDL